MKKYDSILAFGDSFFAGFGLIDNWREKYKFTSIIELDNYTKQNSFPNLLSKKLNIPCYNYSMSGSCNDRSLRKLYKVAAENKINLKNSLILFWYTSTDRFEFYDNNKSSKIRYLNQDEENFVQIQIDLANSKISNTHPLTNTYLKYFSKNYQNTGQYMFFVDGIF